ncbi:glycoprotein [Kwoniella mangroviensis CBS 10435]|uniref:Glycoprotein n=1 Tax=Kwoniella mangroviensis CBS 10435 TaxID=1331196 RepID=A0A1B9IG73_9TREE|nr:glycoprotein [Kwoniella mangroviensis CBS 10435]
MYQFIPLLALLPSLAQAQVTATFPNGPTNPDKPEFYPIGSYVNSTSESRLITLNGVDDFCLWGPPDQSGAAENEIGNVEPIVVAYCTKPRNGARLIPDGAITAAHFIKTPNYVQIYGFWDGTKVGIVDGDAGGELDPHGAENLGNPIGGNVTSNVGGSDVFYEEWMSFISYDQFCLRVCTAETGNVTAALQCEHELDIMGCQFVMAIEDFYQSNNTFTECEGESAAPPGLYPQPDGSYSTFRQRYTGTYTADGTVGMFTVGQTVTPSSVAFYPATSNCKTYSTISNGINTGDWAVTATPSVLVGGSTQAGSVGTTSQSRPSGASAAASTSGASGSASAWASASRSGASGSASAAASGSSTQSNANASGSNSAAKLTFNTGSTNLLLGAGVAVVGMLVGAVSLL